MFYENKHDDPLVRTILCQDEIFSALFLILFIFSTMLSASVRNLDRGDIVASRRFKRDDLRQPTRSHYLHLDD